MKDLFFRVKEKLSDTFQGSGEGEEMKEEEAYVELGPQRDEGRTKIIVRPYVIEDFEDIKPILDSLREGYTIALINIRPLKDKDLVELKRAVNKLKKTTEAIDGDVAGFGEDYIVVTPSFASIYRSGGSMPVDDDMGGPAPKSEPYD